MTGIAVPLWVLCLCGASVWMCFLDEHNVNWDNHAFIVYWSAICPTIYLWLLGATARRFPRDAVFCTLALMVAALAIYSTEPTIQIINWDLDIWPFLVHTSLAIAVLFAGLCWFTTPLRLHLTSRATVPVNCLTLRDWFAITLVASIYFAIVSQFSEWIKSDYAYSIAVLQFALLMASISAVAIMLFTGGLQSWVCKAGFVVLLTLLIEASVYFLRATTFGLDPHLFYVQFSALYCFLAILSAALIAFERTPLSPVSQPPPPNIG